MSAEDTSVGAVAPNGQRALEGKRPYPKQRTP